MTSRFIYFVVGIIVSSTVPELSRASTVFTSFPSGSMYGCCGMSFVAGTAGNFPGPNPGLSLAAGAFTPDDNFNLTQIDVAFTAVSRFSEVYPSGFAISLAQDSGGQPGATIETWTGLTAPLIAIGVSSLVESVSPVSTVTLLAGKQYWVVASPSAPDTVNGWLMGNQLTDPGGTFAVCGQEGYGSAPTCPNWNVWNVSHGALLFDVQGTPMPEPGTLPLLASALLGASCYVKRKGRI
jgi:hypothetical protein